MPAGRIALADSLSPPGYRAGASRKNTGVLDFVAIRLALRDAPPMAIDHDQRRAAIAKIAVDLVAREGMEAATIRRIAAEAGFSTAAVTSYFIDKQELLSWAFRLLCIDGESQFDEALARPPAEITPADVEAALMTLVPWCPANVRRWKAYLAFWDQAARDPELAVLVADSARVGLVSVERLLRVAAPQAADVTGPAELLQATIQGLALQILVDRANWPEAKIVRTLLGAYEAAVGKVRAASALAIS